ncbi:MAG: FeoA family protein [Tissierellia bacterium]|nr:FeoA family protein [Tissierellia bacterium]
MRTLREIAIGESVKVVKLHGLGPIKRRIMEMGITKGTQIKLENIAPLGDPMEITVRNYRLSIRKEDASLIEVE